MILARSVRLSPERCRKTRRTGKQSPHLIAGYVGSAERFEQPSRAGQRVDQYADHAIFNLSSGHPPAFPSCLGDLRSRDVVAISPAFLDRV
jgi:hypothetical protein